MEAKDKIEYIVQQVIAELEKRGIVRPNDKASCTKLKKTAVVFGAIAVLLGIISMFTPPMWIIDGSVIAFVGEIFAFAALFMAWEGIDRGIDAKVTHGQTEIELTNPDNKKEDA